MNKLEQLHAAIQTLEDLGLPVSEEQRRQVKQAEDDYIDNQLIPVIPEELNELTVDIKSRFHLMVDYDPENGVTISKELEPKREVRIRVPKSEVQPNIKDSERKKKFILRVTFPDGTSYSYRKVAETMAAVVKKIGAQRVMNLGLQLCGDNIITTTPNEVPKYRTAQFEVGEGYYLQTLCNTERKIAILEKISGELDLRLVITKLPI